VFCSSIPTLDQKAVRETDPHTPNPTARIRRFAELNRAGVPTGVLIAPLIAGDQRRARAVSGLLVEATPPCALRPEVWRAPAQDVRRRVHGLAAHRTPDLVPLKREAVCEGAYAPQQAAPRLLMVLRGRLNPGRSGHSALTLLGVTRTGNARRPATSAHEARTTPRVGGRVGAERLFVKLRLLHPASTTVTCRPGRAGRRWPLPPIHALAATLTGQRLPLTVFRCVDHRARVALDPSGDCRSCCR